MTTILGVDPGIRGGLAIITVDDGAAPRLIDAIDIPVTGTGAKERVDAIALRALTHGSLRQRLSIRTPSLWIVLDRDEIMELADIIRRAEASYSRDARDQ